MKRFVWAAMAASAFFIGAPAQAGVDITFGADVPIGDDGQLFLAISSRCFDQEPRVIRDYAPRFTSPEDMAVALFISQHSGKPIEAIFKLRQGGIPWWDVGVRVGLPEQVWFVPVSHHPGPPFGKAWGHWKKHQADHHYAMRFDDDDARNWVAVRMMHEYYGIPVEKAMEFRARGVDVRSLMVHEYRNRHGEGKEKHKNKVPDAHGHHGRDKDQGKDRGKR